MSAATGVWNRAKERRWELTAAATVTALVVGLPWLTNGGLSGGRSHTDAFATTTTMAAGEAATVLGATADARTAPAGPAGQVADDFLALLQSVSAPELTAPGTTVPPSTTPIPAATTTTIATTTVTSPAPTSTTLPAKRPTPRAPTRLALDFGGTALIARWDAVTTESDGSPFSGGYEVTVKAGATTKTYDAVASSFTYTLDQNRLDFGTAQPELTLTVRAVDAAGTAGPATSGFAVHDPPATPAAAPILTAALGQITIFGQVPAGASDVAGFDIYEYLPGSPTPYVFLQSTTGIDAFVHQALASGSTHTYVYKTRDVFGQDSAGYSAAATATAF
jgi:hypothetical protein